MRDARKAARESAKRSQALVQRTLRQADLAERRVRAAEAAAEAALLRVKRAEAAAQVAEAPAHRAEEQMRAAQAKQAEAQMWLKHLDTCVLTEFEGLTEKRD